MDQENSRQIENKNEEEEDGREFVMLGQFALKVNGELPLELSVHTTDRIGELIFDDLTEQGLVPGSSVNISMDMMLYSPDQAKEELGLRRAR